MTSLRAKLFLRVGVILFVFALLAFFMPTFFIHKDINSASAYLTQIYTAYLKKLDNLSSSWVSYRFIHTAAQLDAVSQALDIKKESSWQLAASVIAQDPDISVVQVTGEGRETAVITPESGDLYTPFWAKDFEGNLWVKINDKGEPFLAKEIKTAENQEKYYLLTQDPHYLQSTAGLDFIPFASDTQKVVANSRDAQNIYQVLLAKENLLFTKMKMIQALIPWRDRAQGLLFVDETAQKGSAILTEELLSSKAIEPPVAHSQVPIVLYRKEGPFVDIVQFAVQQNPGDPEVLIGYSLSKIASEIAGSLQKPVLLWNRGLLLQGFTPDGEALPIDAITVLPESTLWNGIEYIPYDIPLLHLTFSLLIPKAEKMAVATVMSKIRHSLTEKISLTLFLIALGLLLISLLLLAKISKKITRPITQLALASEEIGKGKYEGLQLPPVEKRKDEVAILTHSFQKMVLSLRDREKIRGVLNKVVSKEIASTILNSNIEFGGEERFLTMLFSDIRGFTPLSETLAPQKLIQLLNSYMTRMCRIIDETHGVVDKFVGDEIMALYGAPLDLQGHAEKAVEAALLMIEELKKWNGERGPNAPQIAIGIGVHTGTAFAGNMGAEDRLNYTVVGANVNLAARLCSAAKPMQILISEQTAKALPASHPFHLHALPPVSLKGIDYPIPVYEVTRT